MEENNAENRLKNRNYQIRRFCENCKKKFISNIQFGTLVGSDYCPNCGVFTSSNEGTPEGITY